MNLWQHEYQIGVLMWWCSAPGIWQSNRLTLSGITCAQQYSSIAFETSGHQWKCVEWSASLDCPLSMRSAWSYLVQVCRSDWTRTAKRMHFCNQACLHIRINCKEVDGKGQRVGGGLIPGTHTCGVCIFAQTRDTTIGQACTWSDLATQLLRLGAIWWKNPYLSQMLIFSSSCLVAGMLMHQHAWSPDPHKKTYYP